MSLGQMTGPVHLLPVVCGIYSDLISAHSGYCVAKCYSIERTESNTSGNSFLVHRRCLGVVYNTIQLYCLYVEKFAFWLVIYINKCTNSIQHTGGNTSF